MELNAMNEFKISLRGSLADEYAQQEKLGIISFINRKRLQNELSRHQEDGFLVVYKRSEKALYCDGGVSKRG